MVRCLLLIKNHATMFEATDFALLHCGGSRYQCYQCYTTEVLFWRVFSKSKQEPNINRRAEKERRNYN